MIRINKFLTDSGYCSRREADKYIEQGRVTVNGVVAELGQSVSDMDKVEVDGEKVGTRKKKRVYLILNKPVGVTCTTDRRDKTNIIDFINYKERIFPVGRLDKDSQGLIILTNDGDIVNKILRAGNNNPKEYIVTVNKPITNEFIEKMSQGVHILGTKTKPCQVVRKNENTFLIYLTQGLNRQIRRMSQALGYKVVKLKRLKVMNLTLDGLETGRWRYLTPEEEQEMQRLLAASSGTEEASNELKPKPARPAKRQNTGPEIKTKTLVRTKKIARTDSTSPTNGKPNSERSKSRSGSFASYRQKGKVKK